MEREKKRSAAVAAGLAVLFLTPLVVFALLLRSTERVNSFEAAFVRFLCSYEYNILPTCGKCVQTACNP